MKEFIEKLIGRLEVNSFPLTFNFETEKYLKYDKTIEIVNQLAEEQNNVMIDEQYCFQTCGATEHCKECNRLCNGDIDYYENYDFMAEEHNNGWIPCSERLPDDFMSMEYLTTVKGRFYSEMNYYCVVNHKWYSNERTTKEVNVIAWMPKPTVYQPKGEKND